MQRYTEIPSSETLANSLSLILQNDKTSISCSAGTAFPTVDTQEGMLCYRTDEKKLYQLVNAAEKTWRVVADVAGNARNLDGGFGNAIDYNKRNLNEWNDMPTGFYEGSNMLNAPSGDTYWRVIQIRQGDSNGYATQIAFGAATGKVCTRYQNGGQWSKWNDLYTGADGKVVANLNADMLDDKHAGHGAGQIPVSDGVVNTSLNADKLDGYDAGNDSGKIPVSNGVLNQGLNADMLDNMQSGNASGNIPISNGKLNVNLNAEMLGGLKVTDFVTVGQGGVVGNTLESLKVNNLTATNILSERTYGGSKQAQRGIISDYKIGNVDSKGDFTVGGGGDFSHATYALNTIPGIPGGSYQLQTLLQMLVNCSHTHALSQGTAYSNCNCDCRCDCNCSDSDNA